MIETQRKKFNIKKFKTRRKQLLKETVFKLLSFNSNLKKSQTG